MKPSEVFVPGRFPIHEHNVYADRGQPQRLVEQAWQRGFVPIIYGPYGSGKSSLARFCSRPWDTQNKLVYIESVAHKSLASIFQRILEFIGYEVVVEQTNLSERDRSLEAGFGVEGGLLTMLKARVSGKLSRKQKKALSSRRELLVKSPTDSKVFDLCEEFELLLLIDELHRASDAFRSEISSFLKAYANRNAEQFRVGLIGTEDDAGSLVVRDPGIDRLLQEVSVPTISDTEARDIIYPGMNKLDLIIREEVAEKVVKAGVGSPFIVQYLCLDMAEMARSKETETVSVEMYRQALQNYIESKAQRALQGYRRAIETTGPKRYRKQILHAMATLEQDYVTMEQLSAQVSKQLGEEVPSTTLSGPLRDLKSDKFGSVLRDVPGSSPGTRAFNYSAFADPAMKAVVRQVVEIGDIP